MTTKTIPARGLHQPYAGLMAIGLKDLETRKTRVHLRGELLICSTLTTDRRAFDTLRARLVPSHVDADVFDLWCKPVGMGLCVVTITGCRPLVPEDEPRSFFYEPGRFAWETDKAKLQRVEPFHVRCQQGQFPVDFARLRPFSRGAVATTTMETDYSYICKTAPGCQCTTGPNEWDECNCTPKDDGALRTTCTGCDAPMHAIDFETGEDLPEGATSSFTGVS